MTTEENLQRDQSPTISGETDNGKAQAEEYHIISPNASKFRKAIVLILVCLALFVDSFNTGGMIICLNEIGTDLGQNPAIVQWVLTAFNLTFGSFLLLAGRISDIYHPKPVFIVGFFVVGVFGIGAGFTHNIIGLIVIRAIQGIGAAMTIPSAISMLTSAYTEPAERGVALTFFAAAGTVGLCLGFVLGGVIVKFASWRWVFWAIACAAVPLSLSAIFIIPVDKMRMKNKDKKMDAPGVFLLTASLILIIFSLSEAPTVGWGTARVLAPLIVSVLLMCAFLWWQTRLHEEHALIPSKMWFIPNFLILIIGTLCNQIYFIGPVVLFSNYYPATYGWSPLTVGLHFLPVGIVGGIICIVLPLQVLRLPMKPVLVGGHLIAGAFTILYAFSNTRERYWSFTFPAMLLVTTGSSVVYLISNVAVITSVPPDKVGVGSAIFNAAIQVGTAINVAVVTTILVEISKKHPAGSYKGPAAALYWIVAIGFFQAALALFFFRPQNTSLVKAPDAPAAEEKRSTEKDNAESV